MPDLPREFALPPGFPILDLTTGNQVPPIPPQDAATVALVRSGRQGMEVFLLRRVSTMAFAGGMTVFPGGRVDRADIGADVSLSGPKAEWWADQFGCDPQLAIALICAAVRETFEETGVLFAGKDPYSIIDDTSCYHLERQALVERKLSLASFLATTGLIIRGDLLRPFAHWITPAEEPRRYNTRFFLAALPKGQHADGDTSEADQAGWQRPADAIADWRDGRTQLLPPTLLTLAELIEAETVEIALGMEWPIVAIEPRIIRRHNTFYAVLPENSGVERNHKHG